MLDKSQTHLFHIPTINMILSVLTVSFPNKQLYIKLPITREIDLQNWTLTRTEQTLVSASKV